MAGSGRRRAIALDRNGMATAVVRAIAKTLVREGRRFLILSRGLSLQLRRSTQAKPPGIGRLLAPGPPFHGTAQPIGQVPLCVAAERQRVGGSISLHEPCSRPMHPKGKQATIQSFPSTPRTPAELMNVLR